MADRSEEIKRLCSEWRARSVTHEAGATRITVKDTNPLLSAGIQPHELTWDELRAAFVGLTSILLLPGRNSIGQQDHHWLWAWAETLLHEAESGTKPSDELRALQELRKRAVRLLIGLRTSLAMGLPGEASMLLFDGGWSVGFLGFPLLEGTLRASLHTYVDMTGHVLAGFTAGGETYGPPGQPGRSRCSSLQALLDLQLQQGGDLAQDIREMVDHLTIEVDGSRSGDPLELIYDWRNSTSHAGAGPLTVGGTLVYLALRVELESVKDDYEAVAEKGREHVMRFVRNVREGMTHRAHWELYPPGDLS